MKKLFIASAFFVMDRLIKFFAPSINLGGGFVKIGFFPNYAGAFSLPFAGMLYNAAGIILLMTLLYFIFKEWGRKTTKIFSFLLLFFGGLSNLFDRLFYGSTIDYVSLGNFSIFNLADGMIIMGIAALLYDAITSRDKRF